MPDYVTNSPQEQAIGVSVYPETGKEVGPSTASPIDIYGKHGESVKASTRSSVDVSDLPTGQSAQDVGRVLPRRSSELLVSELSSVDARRSVYRPSKPAALPPHDVELDVPATSRHKPPKTKVNVPDTQSPDFLEVPSTPESAQSRLVSARTEPSELGRSRTQSSRSTSDELAFADFASSAAGTTFKPSVNYLDADVAPSSPELLSRMPSNEGLLTDVRKSLETAGIANVLAISKELSSSRAGGRPNVQANEIVSSSTTATNEVERNSLFDFPGSSLPLALDKENTVLSIAEQLSVLPGIKTGYNVPDLPSITQAITTTKDSTIVNSLSTTQPSNNVNNSGSSIEESVVKATVLSDSDQRKSEISEISNLVSTEATTRLLDATLKRTKGSKAMQDSIAANITFATASLDKLSKPAVGTSPSGEAPLGNLETLTANDQLSNRSYANENVQSAGLQQLEVIPGSESLSAQDSVGSFVGASGSTSVANRNVNRAGAVNINTANSSNTAVRDFVDNLAEPAGANYRANFELTQAKALAANNQKANLVASSEVGGGDQASRGDFVTQLAANAQARLDQPRAASTATTGVGNTFSSRTPIEPTYVTGNLPNEPTPPSGLDRSSAIGELENTASGLPIALTPARVDKLPDGVSKIVSNTKSDFGVVDMASLSSVIPRNAMDSVSSGLSVETQPTFDRLLSTSMGQEPAVSELARGQTFNLSRAISQMSSGPRADPATLDTKANLEASKEILSLSEESPAFERVAKVEKAASAMSVVPTQQSQVILGAKRALEQGRTRDAALPDEVISRELERSLGSKTKAESVLGSSTSDSSTSSYQMEKNLAAQSIKSVIDEVKNRNSREPAISEVLASRSDSLAVNTTASNRNRLRSDSDNAAAGLYRAEDMRRTNDIPHIKNQSLALQQYINETARQSFSEPYSENLGQGQRHANQLPGSTLGSSSFYGGNQALNMLQVAQAPNISFNSDAKVETRKSDSQRMFMTGTMKLINNNGQPLGEGQFDLASRI